MQQIRFKCPACGEKVEIQGTTKKICPYCGKTKKEFIRENNRMKYHGKIYMGSNQAGKGDSYRPKSKHLNENLFFTPEQVEKFEAKYKKTHCYLCKQRAYFTKTFLLKNKKLVVCKKCEGKVYA